MQIVSSNNNGNSNNINNYSPADTRLKVAPAMRLYILQLQGLSGKYTLIHRLTSDLRQRHATCQQTLTHTRSHFATVN